MSYRQPLSSTRSISPGLDEQELVDERQPMMSEKGYEEDDITLPKRSHRLPQSILPWIPHLLLLATYCCVILTWPKFKPHLHGTHYTSSTNETVEHWEARFLGTFSEIGDYFNISGTKNPSPGAQAAWRVVQRAEQTKPIERSKANFVRINRAYITSPRAGDPQALTHIHRLHCLHVLWRRWHGQITEEESRARIATEGHDSHCFEILRYALMCDSSLTIEKVGWTGSMGIHADWIDVAAFCKDPELDGVEIRKIDNGSDDVSDRGGQPKTDVGTES